MNKARKFSIKQILLTMCLMGVMMIFQSLPVMAASAVEQPTVVVSNFSQLYSAMIQARDGDVIGIDSSITIVAEGETLGKVDKHVTLLRMNKDARFVFSAKQLKVQNITFDGNGINGWYSMIQVNTDTDFENVTFVDCHTDMNGGAIFIPGGKVNITDCTFQNNSASNGGHISIWNDSNVQINRCTFEGGYASSKGGAIEYDSSAPWCNITSSLIYNNSAGSCGGGIFNNKRLIIAQTKIYGNTASTGGADIANSIYSNIQIEYSIEELSALYKDDKIIPKGWVNDYDFESGVVISGISPELPNALMKLDYEIPPTAVLLDTSSLGFAGNSKITGLQSGKYYKITADDIISYVKSDGTLTTTESEISTLIGTEIIGLINGKTYKVEEYTPVAPEPTTVILDSASLGAAGDGKITGLTSGKKYKVSVDGTISYSKADGTLTAIEAEATALEGTEILNLTNGKTYLVEEYTAPVVDPGPSKPTEPSTPTEPENPNPVDPTPTPDPTPVTPPSSNNNSSGGSSHSHHSSSTVTTVTQPETKKAVVLSYGKAVLDTTKTEYLIGYTDGMLGGKDTLTKAQFVQIVYRMLTPESRTAVYSEKSSFKDVASNAWYYEAVNSMANAGLVSVGADGKFNPDKNVTWGEMVNILAKFAKPNSEWKIITKHWAKDSLNTAISYRWFNYTDEFNPDGEVTRLEMLNFINTMFKWSK